MTASNESELRQMFSSGIQHAINWMLQELVKENKNKIEKTVYNGYSPNWYGRTNDFKESWNYEENKSLGGLGGGEFDFHPEMLSVGTQEDGQHASIVNGAPFTEGLADAIYQGYDMPRNGVHIPPRNAFKKIDSWFSQNKITELFNKGLKRSGFQVAKKGGADKTEL